MELSPIKQQLLDYDEWAKLDDVYSPSVIPAKWDYWATFTWSEILNVQQQNITLLSLDGKSIFDTYAGLSSGIGDDNSTINVTEDSVVIINDVAWDTYLV